MDCATFGTLQDNDWPDGKGRRLCQLCWERNVPMRGGLRWIIFMASRKGSSRMTKTEKQQAISDGMKRHWKSRKRKVDGFRSIGLCYGTAQINMHADGRITLAGEKKDEQKLRFLCVDGLRDRIADLNAKLDLCIEAAEQMKAQWPECDVFAEPCDGCGSPSGTGCACG